MTEEKKDSGIAPEVETDAGVPELEIEDVSWELESNGGSQEETPQFEPEDEDLPSPQPETPFFDETVQAAEPEAPVQFEPETPVQFEPEAPAQFEPEAPGPVRAGARAGARARAGAGARAGARARAGAGTRA